MIQTEDGTTFVYINNFGGTCKLPVLSGLRLTNVVKGLTILKILSIIAPVLSRSPLRSMRSGYGVKTLFAVGSLCTCPRTLLNCLILGVNLGGWLITEPFIVPALYEKYQNVTPPAIDEWTLSIAMRNDTGPGGGIQQLEDHYKTFIVSII